MASTVPILNKGSDRINSILHNTSAIFEISRNTQADGSRPLNSVRYYGIAAVDSYSSYIDSKAAMAGIDPAVVKAIMYVENAQGWYDGFKPAPESLLPMNVRPDIWGGLLGNNINLNDPYRNIDAGITLISRIQQA